MIIYGNICNITLIHVFVLPSEDNLSFVHLTEKPLLSVSLQLSSREATLERRAQHFLPLHPEEKTPTVVFEKL